MSATCRQPPIPPVIAAAGNTRSPNHHVFPPFPLIDAPSLGTMAPPGYVARNLRNQQDADTAITDAIAAKYENQPKNTRRSYKKGQDLWLVRGASRCLGPPSQALLLEGRGG